MENKKGKCILLILFVVSFITLKLLHANDNNLDNFHAIDDAPYNWIVFDYTGKPNLPEMIKVRRPNKLCAGTIFAKTDYEFAKNLFEVPVTERANWLEQQIAKQIDNIGDFERAMKALGEVR